jgi:phage tail-like protein
MTTSVAKPPSSLLQYLPAIYHEDSLLGQLLSIFEKILLGREDIDLCYRNGVLVTSKDDPDVCYKGLEETISGLADLFDPNQTPKEFLEWLSGWVALTLRADLDELRQRDFIARAVWLYRLRGTKQGLEQSIAIYTRLGVTIDEADAPFQIGVHSKVGVDTILDGGTPHFFRVFFRLPTADPDKMRTQKEVVRAIVEMEKPAHTYGYVMDPITPSLQIAVNSTIGADTLLGTPPI